MSRESLCHHRPPSVTPQEARHLPREGEGLRAWFSLTFVRLRDHIVKNESGI
jgi:hypothetical protein